MNLWQVFYIPVYSHPDYNTTTLQKSFLLTRQQLLCTNYPALFVVIMSTFSNCFFLNITRGSPKAKEESKRNATFCKYF